MRIHIFKSPAWTLGLLRLLKQNTTGGEAATIDIYFSQFWRETTKIKVLVVPGLVVSSLPDV